MYNVYILPKIKFEQMKRDCSTLSFKYSIALAFFYLSNRSMLPRELFI